MTKIEDKAINLQADNLDQHGDCELIVGNSNPRFSGVTSTMLQTLAHQQNLMSVRVLGAHHLPDPRLAIGFWQLAKLARKPRTDGKARVFHARRNDEMIQALLLKYLFGAKFKIVFTSTAQRQHSGFSRWLMSKMDAVISTCEAAASYLQQPPLRIIPHGIDSQAYHPAEDQQLVRDELKLPGQQVIGIFGRVREQKGVHLFIQACADLLPRYPDASAVIVGAISADNQTQVDDWKQQLQQAGVADRVRITGELPFEQIPRYFQACSVVMALSRTEGFGLTVLEAMSSGAAVIATRAGAWPEIIREGTDGYVVEVDDLQAIEQRLASCLDNPKQTATMGQNGRQRILEQYTIEHEARQLCDFFRTLQ